MNKGAILFDDPQLRAMGSDHGDSDLLLNGGAGLAEAPDPAEANAEDPALCGTGLRHRRAPE